MNRIGLVVAAFAIFTVCASAQIPQTPAMPTRPVTPTPESQAQRPLRPLAPPSTVTVSEFAARTIRCETNLTAATVELEALLFVELDPARPGLVDVDVLVDGVSVGAASGRAVRHGDEPTAPWRVTRSLTVAGARGDHSVVFVANGARSAPLSFTHSCVTPTPIAPEGVGVRARSWAERGYWYEISFDGFIEQGSDTAREDSAVYANVVMRNGRVIPLRVREGAGRLSMRGSSRFVMSLDEIIGVEIILARAIYTDRLPATIVERDNLAPDSWDLNRVQLTARLSRSVRTREGAIRDLDLGSRVLDFNPRRRMTYGIWASTELTHRTFSPPDEVRRLDGTLSFRVLTGADGMKSGPASVAVLVETPAGRLRDDTLTQLADRPPAPYREFLTGRFWNGDNGAEFGGLSFGPRRAFRWASVGRVGLHYRYGDHGLERDDWDINAVLVDFCPLVFEIRLCFRKASYYSYPNPGVRLVRMNGDGAGTEVWAPFY